MDVSLLFATSLVVVLLGLVLRSSWVIRTILHRLKFLHEPQTTPTSLKHESLLGNDTVSQKTSSCKSRLQLEPQTLSKYQVESTYATQTWQRKAHDSFVATLVAKSPVFPCIYATKGFKANDQRFLFLDSDHLSSPSNVSAVASVLTTYLAQSRQLGPNTSLVILCKRSQSLRSVQDYHDDYWCFLKSLRSLDAKPWPAGFPEEINSDTWCFCFNGIPTFTVVQTPAHKHRQSRYAPNLRVIIQPKWIFNALFSTPKKRIGALKMVRELLRDYDDIPISPDLKNYGEEGSRESRQYFLLDENMPALCPYQKLTA